MTSVDSDLLDRVRVRLTDQRVAATAANVAAALRGEGGLAGDEAVLDVMEAMRLDSQGAGPLETLLRHPGVTDVLVNGPDEVYVDDGGGLRQTAVRFSADAAVRRLAQRLATAAGRRLDDSSPFVDVRLPDGTRLHAVLSPVASPGTCLSLRVPARVTFSLDEMVAAGSLSSCAAGLLRDVVHARLAFLVSGGTGSGKTTMLAALLSEVDPRERIVVVEDSAELRPRSPHVVGLAARQPNVEGVGAISLKDLVRQSLRMRPDRLVVGEVRGAEVVDLLAALNTGHDGGCGTIHANSAHDVPARIEALGAGAGMAREAVHAQLASAIQLVVHMRRNGGGVRGVTELGVLTTNQRGMVEALPAVTFSEAGEAQTHAGAERLERLLSGRQVA